MNQISTRKKLAPLQVFLLVGLISVKVLANPCDDLRERLGIADKVDTELNNLKNSCEVYLVGKKDFINLNLNPFFGAYPFELFLQARQCVITKLKKQKNELTIVAKKIKSIPIAAFDGVDKQLQGYIVELSNIESEIRVISESGIKPCYSQTVNTYITKLSELGKPYKDDTDIMRKLGVVENKIDQIEQSIYRLLKTAQTDFVVQIQTLKKAVAHKIYLVRQAKYDQIRGDIGNDLKESADQMLSLEFVMKFLTGIDYDRRLTEAQVKAGQAMVEIATDDLHDLLDQVQKFIRLTQSRMNPTGAEILANSVTAINNSITLYKSKTLEEKDKRVLSLLKAMRSSLVSTEKKCNSQFITFNKRYQIFTKASDALLSAYQQTISLDLAKGRHRYAETVLLDGHHLVKLCSQATGDSK
jgi:hypothetical protein